MATRSKQANDGLRDQFGSAASDVAKDAKVKLNEGVEEVKGEAFSVADELKNQAKSALNDSTNQMAGHVRGIANALGQTTKGLSDENQTELASYSDSLGSQIEQVADYLENKDPSDIARDLEGFARRQPAAFIGGAVALGLVAARFLRSSSPQSQRRDGYGHN